MIGMIGMVEMVEMGGIDVMGGMDVDAQYKTRNNYQDLSVK